MDVLIVGFLIYWREGWRVMIGDAVTTTGNRKSSITLPIGDVNGRNEANSANSKNSQQDQAHETHRHTNRQVFQL
jgi:hypothetical protein